MGRTPTGSYKGKSLYCMLVVWINRFLKWNTTSVWWISTEKLLNANMKTTPGWWCGSELTNHFQTVSRQHKVWIEKKLLPLYPLQQSNVGIKSLRLFHSYSCMRVHQMSGDEWISFRLHWEFSIQGNSQLMPCVNRTPTTHREPTDAAVN